jgi:rare lipoprotein A
MADDPSAGMRHNAAAAEPEVRPIEKGRAGYYEHPGRTASGETYKPNGLTAAHRSLPLGTRLQVVNLQNGKSITLRVNDRTPRKVERIIDLSRGSARALGISRKEGVAPVALYVID